MIAVGTGTLPTFGATCDADRDAEIAADNKDTATDPKAANRYPTLICRRGCDPQTRRVLFWPIKSPRPSVRDVTSRRSAVTPAALPIRHSRFVDGDCNLDGGGGLLIVTGTLTMSGNPSFSGLILVLGDGRIQRNGGGNGDIYGAITVARFDSTGPVFLAAILSIPTAAATR